mmetsp:Transcript_115776/g.374097  ORF Transcript_115776/g.374097 Transcript_115776/m.374097 type:complete len:238 (+) Transcript_115776:1806-2519(+)
MSRAVQLCHPPRARLAVSHLLAAQDATAREDDVPVPGLLDLALVQDPLPRLELHEALGAACELPALGAQQRCKGVHLVEELPVLVEAVVPAAEALRKVALVDHVDDGVLAGLERGLPGRVVEQRQLPEAVALAEDQRRRAGGLRLGLAALTRALPWLSEGPPADHHVQCRHQVQALRRLAPGGELASAVKGALAATGCRRLSLPRGLAGSRAPRALVVRRSPAAAHLPAVGLRGPQL